MLEIAILKILYSRNPCWKEPIYSISFPEPIDRCFAVPHFVKKCRWTRVYGLFCIIEFCVHQIIKFVLKEVCQKWGKDDSSTWRPLCRMTEMRKHAWNLKFKVFWTFQNMRVGYVWIICARFVQCAQQWVQIWYILGIFWNDIETSPSSMIYHR